MSHNQPAIVSVGSNMIMIGAADFPRTSEAGGYLRMLAVLSTPAMNERGDGPPQGRVLDLAAEQEQLRAAVGVLDPVNARGAPWAVVPLLPPTLEQLRDALASGAGYQVLHISAHGSSDGLVLVDNQAREHLVSRFQLVEALRDSNGKSRVQLVVLNACETFELGQNLIELARVPCVIATHRPIDDAEARILTERLYRRLASGETVKAALNEAKRTLRDRLGRDLHLSGSSQERVDNIELLGNGDFSLTVEGTPAAGPVFARAIAQNDPLPFDRLEGFVGRGAEIREIVRWLHQPSRRAFAISGVGGTGKTTLALKVALSYAAGRFTALAFASAKDLSEFGPVQVLNTLAAATGDPMQPGEQENVPAAIARRLNRRAILLILDNLESVGDAQAAELARALAGFDASGGSRVLMTLRPAQHDPLTEQTSGDGLQLEPLDRGSALRLLWERISRFDFNLRKAWGPSLLPKDIEQIRTIAMDAGLPHRLAQVELAALDALARRAFNHPEFIKLTVAMLRQLDA